MTATHTPSVTADNQEAVQGFQPFGPMANDDSALLLGFDDPGPFPALELNLAIATLPDNSATAAFQCGLPDGPGVRFGDARDGNSGTAATGRDSACSRMKPARSPVPVTSF